jgi:hypothetical protein
MENIEINGKNVKCSKVVKDEIEHLRMNLKLMYDLTCKFDDLNDELKSNIIVNVRKKSELIREIQSLYLFL